MPDELANHALALRTYLRESTVLASASYLGSNQKIYTGLPRDKENKLSAPPFTDMIVIMPGRGGRGDIGLGQEEDRVDIYCYGSDAFKCMKLWRALDAYLLPRFGPERKFSFTRNNCQVNFLLREGGPLELTDPDAANWPYTLGTYLVNYNAKPKA